MKLEKITVSLNMICRLLHNFMTIHVSLRKWIKYEEVFAYNVKLATTFNTCHFHE